jgi:hypothetical protein
MENANGVGLLAEKYFSPRAHEVHKGRNVTASNRVNEWNELLRFVEWLWL